MDELLRDIASPDLYPQKFDPLRDAALIVMLSEREYRAASFLDDRIISAAKPGTWVSCSALETRSANIQPGRPLHFLFHAGHAGSTLISRLLDETGLILGLREPLPLRTLAQLHDLCSQPSPPLSAARFAARLELFLALWSRGYPWTDAVLLKATSSTGGLASLWWSRRPSSRAIYLNLARETYLATVLSRSAAIADTRGFAQERMTRLSRLVGDFGRTSQSMSAGELAAASWLVERLAEEAATRTLGERLLRLDFDDFLGDRRAGMARILAHLKISVSADQADRLQASPVMQRYSKAPDEFAYSPDLRAQVLAESRKSNQAEITRGQAFLESLGAKSRTVAEVL